MFFLKHGVVGVLRKAHFAVHVPKCRVGQAGCLVGGYAGQGWAWSSHFVSQKGPEKSSTTFGVILQCFKQHGVRFTSCLLQGYKMKNFTRLSRRPVRMRRWAGTA